MTAARGDGGWLPARWPRRWRCAARGHVWASTPTAACMVLVVCARCGEAVLAPFTAPTVLGADPAGPTTVFGSAGPARAVLDLVSATLDGDEAAVATARDVALARPGDALDALTRVAVLLAGDKQTAGAAVAALSVLLDLALVRPSEGGRPDGD